MGSIRQSKIAGYQLGASKGFRPFSKKDELGYKKLVAEEASAKAKKAARKAKYHRALGKASLKFKSYF